MNVLDKTNSKTTTSNTKTKKGPCTPHNLAKNYFLLKTRPLLSVLKEGGVDDVTTIGTATTAAGAG